MNTEDDNLLQFTGTEHFYRTMFGIVYTDGVKYVAGTYGAFWLIDEIAIARKIKKLRGEEFQVWTLKVSNNEGVLICDDGNGNKLFTRKIPYTDFALSEIKFYLVDNTLMLPSEY